MFKIFIFLLLCGSSVVNGPHPGQTTAKSQSSIYSVKWTKANNVTLVINDARGWSIKGRPKTFKFHCWDPETKTGVTTTFTIPAKDVKKDPANHKDIIVKMPTFPQFPGSIYWYSIDIVFDKWWNPLWVPKAINIVSPAY